MSNVEEDIKFTEKMIKEYKISESEIKREYTELEEESRKKSIELICYQEELENILTEREQDKKRIEELEEENKIQRKQIMSAFNRGWIPKQKVKDVLIEIQEEFNKLDKEVDMQIKDKNKDYCKCRENIAIMQTLAYCRDKIEELLEEEENQ